MRFIPVIIAWAAYLASVSLQAFLRPVDGSAGRHFWPLFVLVGVAGVAAALVGFLTFGVPLRGLLITGVSLILLTWVGAFVGLRFARTARRTSAST